MGRTTTLNDDQMPGCKVIQHVCGPKHNQMSRRFIICLLLSWKSERILFHKLFVQYLEYSENSVAHPVLNTFSNTLSNPYCLVWTGIKVTIRYESWFCKCCDTILRFCCAIVYFLPNRTEYSWCKLTIAETDADASIRLYHYFCFH